jgi:hypothetical protein
MLRLSQDKLDCDPAATRRLLERSRLELDEALHELRELARGIYPAVLTERGLARRGRVARPACPAARGVGALPADKLPDEIELAAYYVVAEALTNVAKYASATHATVDLTRRDGRLTVAVTTTASAALTSTAAAACAASSSDWRRSRDDRHGVTARARDDDPRQHPCAAGTRRASSGAARLGCPRAPAAGRRGRSAGLISSPAWST